MQVNVQTMPKPQIAEGKSQGVTIHSLVNSVQSKWINWDDSSDRKWLMNHFHWAMKNDHMVTLTPQSN